MPQAANDNNGVTHLMYFRGAMTGGDLFYSRWNTEEPTWTAPIQINSKPRTSIGMGPMDGGDMALTTSSHGESSPARRVVPEQPIETVLYAEYRGRGQILSHNEHW